MAAAAARRGSRSRAVGTAVVALLFVGSASACRQSSDLVDACGNDLSDLRSRVISLDAVTGEANWATEVPAHGSYLVEDPDGTVRVDTLAGQDQTILDAETGELLDARPPRADLDVTIDATGSSLPVGAVRVGDAVQALVVTHAGLEIRTDASVTPDALHLHAAVLTAGEPEPRWQATLAEDGAWVGVSRPVLVGDDVVIVVALGSRPSCF